MTASWPTTINSVEQLDELQSRPGPAAVDALRQTNGDIIVLGAAGKMGLTLSRMLQRASDEAGTRRRIIAVSRFSNSEARAAFESIRAETIAGDLSERQFVSQLPDVPIVFFLGGMKFGATGNEPLTWGMNAWMPALVAERYAGRRIVAFSTGNVYGLAPVSTGGSKESDPLAPVGEYAMSCVARERLFQYFCEKHRSPTTLIRLNYAVEMRYGVILDVAQRIARSEPIDLAMGHVNVIWQGDACNAVIAALADCSVPANVLNVAGAQILRVREIAERLGKLLGKSPAFTGSENSDALLNNASRSHAMYGAPQMPVDLILQWTADWIRRDLPTLGKPTHFESRSGQF